MRVVLLLLFLVPLYHTLGPNTGAVGSSCILNEQPHIVDSCGICGGDGSSCICGNGYLGFSQRDVDTGVLCHTNGNLKTTIDTTTGLLDELSELVGGLLISDGCSMGQTLGVDDWVQHLVGVLEGSSCPTSINSFDTATISFTELLELHQM